MRLCYKCYKNLKMNPGNSIGNKKDGYKLFCNECLKTDLVQSWLRLHNYDVILNCPSLEEYKNETSKI